MKSVKKLEPDTGRTRSSAGGNLTQRQAAALAGVTDRRLRQLENEGSGPPRNGTAYPIAPFAAWLRSRWRVDAGQDRPGEPLDPQQERAALDRERRRAVEMANLKASGELIPADDVRAAWSERIGIAKARLLGLPARVSSDVLRLQDQRAIEARIRDEIHAILLELASE